MLIYCITNIINNKKYIGITKQNLDKRIKQHWRMANSGGGYSLHNSIRKYGTECFKVKIIEECNDQSLAYEREKYWIKTLDTKNNGYNETIGGEIPIGFLMTDELREKHKNNTAKLFTNPDFRKYHKQQTQKGVKKFFESMSLEKIQMFKEKSGKGRKGKIPWNKGKKNTYSHTEEAKNKIGLFHKNKIISEETKKKISINSQKQWLQNNPMNNPEFRKKVSNSKIGRKLMLVNGKKRFLTQQQIAELNI